MEGYIDLKKLTLDELMSIINLYPWFGGARVELCSRMAGEFSEEQFAAAMEEGDTKEKILEIKESKIRKSIDENAKKREK